MKFLGATLFLSAGYLAALVSAQIVQLTSPLPNTTFTAGHKAIITWHPINSTITEIFLSRNSTTNINHLERHVGIASNVVATAGIYAWDIPRVIEDGEYSLVVGTPPNATFVHPIFINDSWICGPRSGFNTSTLF